MTSRSASAKPPTCSRRTATVVILNDNLPVRTILTAIVEVSEQARIELIEHNMRLVAHVVKKFHPPHELLDDYISIGTIGLMKAVSSFTPEKKTRLATYAARCIENEILMHLRVQKKVQKDVSLFEPIGTDKDGQSLQIRDLLQLEEPSAIEHIEQQEHFAELYRYLNTLEPRELEILSYRYGLMHTEPLTQKEIPFSCCQSLKANSEEIRVQSFLDLLPNRINIPDRHLAGCDTVPHLIAPLLNEVRISTGQLVDPFKGLWRNQHTTRTKWRFYGLFRRIKCQRPDLGEQEQPLRI